MVKLRLVLDSNEYIFYFDKKSKDILKLLDNQDIQIFLNDLIFQEVIRNLRREATKYFINLLKNPRFEFVINKIPEDLIEKYKKLGLKKGDVVIAAFCDAIKADYLITENRHFLQSKRIIEFKIISIRDFAAKMN